MLAIGEEVYIVNDGGQYCFINDVRWLEQLPMYTRGNQEGFIGSTAIVCIILAFDHYDAVDGHVYGLQLPSGEQVIYEEFDETERYLIKVK
jgi:hypothetical protein